MAEQLLELLRQLSEHQVLVALAIIIATFILEDGATIAAALLTIENVVHPVTGLSALYIGIVLGDLGLYGIGRYAATHERARLLIGEKRLEKGREWLNHRLITALLGARFVPGMRLPTYVASGFLRIPFMSFALIAIVAIAIWTTIFYSAIVYFGTWIVDAIGPWIWALGGVLLLISIIGPRIWRKRWE